MLGGYACECLRDIVGNIDISESRIYRYFQGILDYVTFLLPSYTLQYPESPVCEKIEIVAVRMEIERFLGIITNYLFTCKLIIYIIF